jgi:hypothetical protein
LRARAAEIRKNRSAVTGPPTVTTIAQVQKELREHHRRLLDLEAFASTSARVDGLLMDPDDDDKAGTE